MTQPVESQKIEDLITGRRTIHDFKPHDIPERGIIKHAIEVACWAPNHHLTEPWHCYFPGTETANSIIELNTQLTREKSGEQVAAVKQKRWSTMPGWLVITCDKSSDPIRDREDYAACCCMIQNLMLYLWSQGIGMKWSTGDVVRSDKFYDLLWIDPASETVVGLFWYGYAEAIPETARNDVSKVIIELP